MQKRKHTFLNLRCYRNIDFEANHLINQYFEAYTNCIQEQVEQWHQRIPTGFRPIGQHRL